MLTRQIPLKQGILAIAARITGDKDIQEALTELGIPHPRPVIVLVGGAGGIGFWEKFPMWKAIRIIARLAEETQSVIVDGGTRSGIMEEMGKQRKRKNFAFPLVGVVFESLLIKRDPKSTLDQNHTHFLLTPGEKWGDESPWISKIATVIAGDRKSITILVNGGNVSKKDIQYSLLENRTAVAMRGTGRLADEITLGDQILAIDISERPAKIMEFLRARLV